MDEKPIVCQSCLQVVSKNKMCTDTCCQACDDQDNIDRHMSVDLSEDFE